MKWPEGIKWEQGFTYFLPLENGICVTGTLNPKQKIGNGSGIWARNKLENEIRVKSFLGNKMCTPPFRTHYIRLV